MNESQRPAGLDILLAATSREDHTYVDPADTNILRHISDPNKDVTLPGIEIDFDSTAADHIDPNTGL